MPETFTVIAHRGASGYLPEHTLQSAELAHAMGADYIELDVVLTKDDVLVVLHDLFLDAISDVNTIFPGTQRQDGQHYVADFSWADIQKLRVRPRDLTKKSKAPAQYATKSNTDYRVSSLEEMVRLLQHLNAASGRDAGIYIEPKSPKFHWQNGQDIMLKLHQDLDVLGMHARNCKLYIQSFDFESLKRARSDLGSDHQLVALMAHKNSGESDTDFAELETREGLAEVAIYCSGIGPDISQCIDIVNFQPGGDPTPGLIQLAHEQGLFVHGYTLNALNLPVGVDDVRMAVSILKAEGMDGVFTDHPDLVLACL